MTASDYIFSAVFIALIFRQVRGRPLTAKSLLVPVAIVVGFAVRYLHNIPTAGNDVMFTALCASAGVVLGCASGLVTTVRAGPDGRPIAKAGPLAVVLWVLGTGSRLAFGLYALHGGGPEMGIPPGCEETVLVASSTNPGWRPQVGERSSRHPQVAAPAFRPSVDATKPTVMCNPPAGRARMSKVAWWALLMELTMASPSP